MGYMPNIKQTYQNIIIKTHIFKLRKETKLVFRIFGSCTVNFGKSHAFPTASKMLGPFQGLNQFVVVLPQLDKTSQYHTENQMLKSFVKILPFHSFQPLFWRQKISKSYL